MIGRKPRLKRRFKANSLEELIIPHFMKNIDPFPHPRGCWVWKGPIGIATGYGKFSIANGTWGAHRISWLLFRGVISDGLWILHKCDNRPCVNPDHLFLGTPMDNHIDMHRKGRWRGNTTVHRRGVQHCKAKFNWMQIRMMRYFCTYLNTDQIAEKLKVTPETIRNVRSYRTYRSEP